MGDIIPFEPRRPRPQAPETRYRIEGALALALDAVDQLVAVLDQLDSTARLPNEPGTSEAQVLRFPGIGPAEVH